MKIFSKNLSFGVDFQLQVPPPLLYKINTHNISGVRNKVNTPDLRGVMTNYVYIFSENVILIVFPNKDKPKYSIT